VVRYADDFVVLAKSRKKAKRAMEVTEEIISKKLNLTLRSNYFEHGNVKELFRSLNEWIRMRLRAYKEGKKALYNQNRRIPTAKLKQLGLKSLTIKS